MVIWNAKPTHNKGGGGVYNLSAFVDSHPGGSASVLEHCGSEVLDWNAKGFAMHALNTERRERLRVGDVCPDQWRGHAETTLTAGTYSHSSVGTPGPPLQVDSIPQQQPPKSNPPSCPKQAGVKVAYSREELKKHSMASDCWVLIWDDQPTDDESAGGIYNLTAFIAQHPGGADTIRRSCGKELTGWARGGFSMHALNIARREGFRVGGACPEQWKGKARNSVSPPPLQTVQLLQSMNMESGTAQVESNYAQNFAADRRTPEVRQTHTPPSATQLPQCPGRNGATPAYTRQQVQEHAAASDCWVLIWDDQPTDDKSAGGVYDLTAFIAQHPGGADTIRRSCGKELTGWARGGFSMHALNTARREGFRVGGACPEQWA